MNKYTDTQVKEALNQLVEEGELKVIIKDGIPYYQETDKVKARRLLKNIGEEVNNDTDTR